MIGMPQCPNTFDGGHDVGVSDVAAAAFQLSWMLAKKCRRKAG
jgi:hypothetical protein